MDSEASSLNHVLKLLRTLPRSRASALRAVDTVVGLARGRFTFRRARRAGRVYAGGPVGVDARGDVALGSGVIFFGGMIATDLVCHSGATVSIGAGSQLNYGVLIEARRSVRIGDRCKIGAMVCIADTSRGSTAPVTIGDGVWIAHGAVIEPGATIGDGSVVSAGSVVTGAIPPGSLAVGNPARVVPLETMARAASY
jgi:acetyltransferase-like isoleucine patch superfamily enzyme